jgi:predicted phosphodiesterase
VRIAIVSDIHGNLTALEAVIADLRETSPDLVLHGGDLAAGGARPVEAVDRIRGLGWQGVLGNTDEMLYRPEALTDFAAQSPHLKRLFDVIEEMAASSREVLGDERLAWLATLPMTQSVASIALVHASPSSLWKAPGAKATDAELESTFAPLAHLISVYAHIHHPYVRRVADRTFVNTGSVSLSYDGDWRASYLLLNDGDPVIRRVEYDLAEETEALSVSGLPHADWVAATLRSGSFVMP